MTRRSALLYKLDTVAEYLGFTEEQLTELIESGQMPVIAPRDYDVVHEADLFALIEKMDAAGREHVLESVTAPA